MKAHLSHALGVALALIGSFVSQARAQAPAQTVPSTSPATRTAATTQVLPPDVLKVEGGYEIVFDLSQVPEFKPWVDAKLKPVCAEWYPKIVAMLPSEGFTAPKRFTIFFQKEGRGVAFASGTRITCAAPWFRGQLDREALGAIVHEMVHIVQQYGGQNRARAQGDQAPRPRNPGWLVEGLADYIRWHLYEPKEKRRRINPDRAKYTDSYHVTGAFLEYVHDNHDKEIIKKLNAAMRERKYTDDLWKQYTGKTIDELWADYIQTLKKQ